MIPRGELPMAQDQDRTREVTIIETLGPLYGPSKELADAFNADGVGIKTEEDRQALEALKSTDLHYYYEETVAGAPEDCGDERHAISMVQAMRRKLAPQNMGGSSSNALIYNFVTGKFENHLDALKGLAAKYEHCGVEYRLGGHDAEGAHAPNCGCAAIDQLLKIGEFYVDPKKRNAMTYLTVFTMGEENFDEAAFASNVAKFERLLEHADRYLPSGYQRATLDLLEQLSPDESVVNHRVGPHQGLSVALNYVHGTRLNQDTLSLAREGRPLQSFGVDVWYAFDLGNKLFLNDFESQREFVTGRLAYDMASALAITDGSLELIAHRPA